MTLTTALDSYLGWEQPEHLTGCRRPQWEVAVRTDTDGYRRTHRLEEQPPHACPDEYCGHTSRFTAQLVRLVCRACGAAHLISGEATQEAGGVRSTSTAELGYGLAPRQLAGLLLWPGHTWLRVGKLESEEPHDFVVTRTGVKTITRDVVVGEITMSRGRRGGIVWTALAVPDPQGPYGLSSRIRYRHANDGHGAAGKGGPALRTVRAAARWVGARLAEAQAGGDR